MQNREDLTIKGGGHGDHCQTALRYLTFKERGSRGHDPENAMKTIRLKPQSKQRARKLWVESGVLQLHTVEVETINM